MPWGGGRGRGDQAPPAGKRGPARPARPQGPQGPQGPQSPGGHGGHGGGAERNAGPHGGRAGGRRAGAAAAGTQRPPRTRPPPGPAGAGLCPLTSDGLVVLLVLFGFALIRTEVIRHFRSSEGLGSAGITQHLGRFRWRRSFPSGPEVSRARGTVLVCARQPEAGGRTPGARVLRVWAPWGDCSVWGTRVGPGLERRGPGLQLPRPARPRPRVQRRV